MLKELRFVQGAVAKKDFIPAMTHFRIENGQVRSFNGTLAMNSPIPFDIDCTPRADQLVRAIDKCVETITLSVTESKRLRVQSGKFRAYIDMLEGATPHVEPAGEFVPFDGELLLKAFTTIFDFIGNDASRPWTNGVLLRGQSAFATNNVCLIEYWLGTETPITINVPRFAIEEIIRIGEPPDSVQVDKDSITFHYSDGRWIRSQLFETNWPDLRRVLDKTDRPAPTPIDPRMFEGLETIGAFADNVGRVYIQSDIMRTHSIEGTGAEYEIDGLEIEGIFQIKMLALLKSVATHISFGVFPEPALFFGERLRGAIIGMRP